MGLGADAPHQLNGQGMQEFNLPCRIDDEQPVRLGHLRRDLGEMFGASKADRNRQTKFRAHARANCSCYFCWWAKQSFASKDIGEASRIVNSLLQSPYTRQLAPLMAVALGLQLARMMKRFEQALAAVSTDQLTPLWNDADQVAAQSFGYSYPSM